MIAHHVCTFTPGQHRAEAWQVPRGHHMVHVHELEGRRSLKVHAVAVPKTAGNSLVVRSEAVQAALPHMPSTTVLVQSECIDPDLIDLIK